MSDHGKHRQYLWISIMCLCGVDYFSTLGYQPSIAFEGAGLLAPIATIILVLVTIFGALPVYRFVATKTPDGVGSLGMIEKLFGGWKSKLALLTLIGFAATDFVITKTLSAADAAAHLIGNPLFTTHAPEWMQGQIGVTLFLLMLLTALFLKGYDEVVGVAMFLVATYLSLTLIVVVASVGYLVFHPSLLEGWVSQISAGSYHMSHAPISGSGLWVILGISLIIFPKLALGLSGFETGVLMIPLVKGWRGRFGLKKEGEEKDDDEHGRIANTRRLLLTAACIMSFFLVCSSIATSTGTIIPVEEFEKSTGGRAADRAIAFIAHGESPLNVCPIFGKVFGTVYDVSTILILWFAGASAMAGLLNLVPKYLPRFGMAPKWVASYRPLVLAFTVINFTVTWAFNADVTAQGGAYATGVLVLITSACVASLACVLQEEKRRTHVIVAFGTITIAFIYTTIANVFERPDGIVIASIFITCVLVISFISRTRRCKEDRHTEFRFATPGDRSTWTELVLTGFPMVLVPHRPDVRDLEEKEREIRQRHGISATQDIFFLEVYRGDTSEFTHSPILEIAQVDHRFVIVARDVVSVPHTIAQIALDLSRDFPAKVIFGWSIGHPLSLALKFVLFGEGDIPLTVRNLLMRLEPDETKRPLTIVG